MYRFLPIVLLATLLLVPVAPMVQADQSDQRLTALFETLKTTDDTAAARAAEAEIWRIWINSGQTDIDALMTEGVVAMSNRRLEDAITIFGQITERAPGFARRPG